MRRKILMVGVGGQGVLTAAHIIGLAGQAAGQNVTVGQLHGMSQRGGSVEATVILGPGKTAFVGPGAAKIVVGFEPLEVLRAVPRFAEGARVLANTGRVMPRLLAQGGEPYPDMKEILREIEGWAGEVRTLDGPRIQAEVGESRALNMALLGALAGLRWLPLEEEALLRAMDLRSPDRFQETNHRAFDLGRSAVTDGREDAIHRRR
jgi:indolepyruvate ferredoxin oxidoreductase beta subunit